MTHLHPNPALTCPPRARPRHRAALLAACMLAAAPAAWAVERVQASDAQLDCAGIAAERAALKPLIDAGQTERGLGTAAAGGAANVGAQVATGQVAGSLFGAFGGLAAKVAGAVAQTTVEDKLAPDKAAQEKAALASARDAFLARLANAKQCDAGGPGQALSPEAFQQLAAIPAGATMAITRFDAASVQAQLAEPVQALTTDGVLNGKLSLAGKTVHLTEFRLLFDIGGEVTANTRSGYLLGTDYGATRATVVYQLPQLDVAAFQLITDRAFADFKQRAGAAGLNLVYEPPADGGVYDATEPASTPEAPVYLDKTLGYGKRRYLVMAPTGMKLVPRGFAGIGAGNIGKRIEWSGKQWEGLSLTMSVNIAELESSGSGSSILRRSGSQAEARSRLVVGSSSDDFTVQAHVAGGLVRTGRPVEVPGDFANFRTVGGYDSDKDAAARVVGVMQNLMGQGANKIRRVEKEVDLDGPAMTRMSLQGLATLNQALVEAMR